MVLYDATPPAAGHTPIEGAAGSHTARDGCVKLELAGRRMPAGEAAITPIVPHAAAWPVLPLLCGECADAPLVEPAVNMGIGSLHIQRQPCAPQGSSSSVMKLPFR